MYPYSKGVIHIDIIDRWKQYLHEDNIPIEWLAIHAGLSKRTTIQILARHKPLLPKYELRLQRALVDYEKQFKQL